MMDRIHILVIYDISNDKRRRSLVKLLQGYGTRVQESAFEAYVSQERYNRIKKQLNSFSLSEDNIRLYRISGENLISLYGNAERLKYQSNYIL